MKKGVNSQTSACNFIKKETLAQVFSCEFCLISKNTFLQNTSVQLLKQENKPMSTGVVLVPLFLTLNTFSKTFNICDLIST